MSVGDMSRSAGEPLQTITAAELLSFPDSLQRFQKFFPPETEPWKWVASIEEALQEWQAEEMGDEEAEMKKDIPPGVSIQGKVFVHKSVKLPPFAAIEGPAWIGPESEIRPGAYVRGRVIVGRGCVLGNSCEFKNCLLLDNVEVPHFNYVGDSILGERAHLGAGVVLANLRLDKANVYVRLPNGKKADSGLRKFGAIFGDGAEAGCNSVIQPGTILGRRSVVLPGLSFGGFLLEGKMVRQANVEYEVVDRKF